MVDDVLSQGLFTLCHLLATLVIYINDISKLCRGHGMWYPSVEQIHINHVALATRALICLVTLTFYLLILKIVRSIAVRWATFLLILMMFLRLLILDL